EQYGQVASCKSLRKPYPGTYAITAFQGRSGMAADDVTTIDAMLEKKKIGMTQEEIPALLIKSVPHQGHTNCLVKRLDTGKYFWTYQKCIYHAYGKLTGERIFSPKGDQ
ncbi:MAG: hypothetical protein ACYC9M_11840, partial [Desulfobulbaceae bacterium]